MHTKIDRLMAVNILRNARVLEAVVTKPKKVKKRAVPISLTPAKPTNTVQIPEMASMEAITVRTLNRLTRKPELIATTNPPILDTPKMVLAYPISRNSSFVR